MSDKREKEIKRLLQTAGRYARRAEELQNEQKAEVYRPALRKYLGKCFKYQNSYGGDSKKWWLYARVTAFDEDALSFGTLEFQRSSENIIEIKQYTHANYDGRNHFGSYSGWIPISESEYRLAKAELKRYMAGLGF